MKDIGALCALPNLLQALGVQDSFFARGLFATCDAQQDGEWRRGLLQAGSRLQQGVQFEDLSNTARICFRPNSLGMLLI